MYASISFCKYLAECLQRLAVNAQVAISDADPDPGSCAFLTLDPGWVKNQIRITRIRITVRNSPGFDPSVSNTVESEGRQ